MKMLSESEIFSLCNEAQLAAEEFIVNAAKESEEEKAAHATRIEKQYQAALQNYEKKLKQYDLDLKAYEENIAKEEADFPKRLAEWEEKEKSHKECLERNYQQALQIYETHKHRAEATGQVYNVPIPRKTTYVPVWTKPVKKTFRKPQLPQAPTKPDPSTNTTFTRGMFPCFSSIMKMTMIMGESPFSDRAIRQISTMDICDPKYRKKAIQILFREMYISKRTSMECSYAEGRGMSPALDGLYGEKLTIFELEQCIFNGFKGKILHNLEIEVENRTIQIDLLFITQKGVFVIESKNYSGSISGAEHQNKWRLRTDRRDYMFYNPISQNQSHINILANRVKNVRWFSMIAFSERCDLEYIDIHKPDVFVFNRYALRNVISDVFETEPDILSPQDIECITHMLRQFCADDSRENPNYKESRGYYSSRTKADDHSNASYHHHRKRKTYQSGGYDYDDYDDGDDYDDDF